MVAEPLYSTFGAHVCKSTNGRQTSFSGKLVKISETTPFEEKSNAVLGKRRVVVRHKIGGAVEKGVF